MKRRDFVITSAALLLGCRESRDAEPATGDALVESAAAEELPLIAETPRRQILGVNSHLLLDEDLQLARELGFTHLRSTLVAQLWTDHPTYAISARENTARTTAYGLGLLYVVHNVHGEVFRMRNDPAAARRFTSVVADMVRTQPPVESWQLWNEQDVWVQAPFGAGALPRQGAERVGENYGRWWSEAYAELKAINPRAQFVTGGAADHADDRWRGFFRGMIDTAERADAIGVHAYGVWDRVRQRLLEVRQIVGPEIPLWLTECGGSAGPHWGLGYQAESWRSTIEGNERERLADRVYPYSLQTDPNDPWYGVRNVDGSDRSVLDWLRARRDRS